MFALNKRTLALVAGTAVAVTTGFTYWVLLAAVVTGSDQSKHTLKITSGMSFDAIVKMMVEEGVITGNDRVNWTAAILRCKNKLKAGKYEVAGGISSYQLLQQLAKGKVKVEWVTIPEGKSARQIAGILNKKIEIDSARFMRLVFDPPTAQKLGIPAPSLEGFLCPETYDFHWGMRPEDIIDIMVRQFQKKIDGEVRTRLAASELTLLQVVTLASIIEGEAVVDSERTAISAVYHNRLKKRLLLQADPTIQYIILDGPRRLLKRDLEIDSPYNTYKYPGLPPGPVNNPGFASILASLYPAEVDYLYFVANGDGTHTFSRTYEEHLRAKKKFDRHRREVKKRTQASNPERPGRG
ncbi:MAG TPA: endolytic transglycosylase MltG [bacterium]